jgi:hypothetical protein
MDESNCTKLCQLTEDAALKAFFFFWKMHETSIKSNVVRFSLKPAVYTVLAIIYKDENTVEAGFQKSKQLALI